MVKVGKNQDESVMRLWLEMEWATPSGPLQLPAGHLFETATTSLRDPEGKLRSIRASPVARALATLVPDSSSEPAMRRAVPERVTSVSGWPPVSAAKDLDSKSVAEGPEAWASGEDCWAATGRKQEKLIINSLVREFIDIPPE
jgi:hypothetical protein